MEEMTTIKVRKTTVSRLQELSKLRGRRESMEQIILELIERYVINGE